MFKSDWYLNWDKLETTNIGRSQSQIATVFSIMQSMHINVCIENTSLYTFIIITNLGYGDVP